MRLSQLPTRRRIQPSVAVIFKGLRRLVRGLPGRVLGLAVATALALTAPAATGAAGPQTPSIPADCTPTLSCVGDLVDYAAMTQSGDLTSVKGSFDSITSNATEMGQNGQNIFSLQLNTNFFTTILCKGHSYGIYPCMAWVQFSYRSDPTFNSVYIQYWLENYGSSCPQGWNEAYPGCFINSPDPMTGEANSKPPKPLTVSELDHVTLTGEILSCGLKAILTFPATQGSQRTTVSTNCEPDMTQSLNGQWNQAEWGIFGASSGDNQADFTTPGGTTLVRERQHA